MHQEIKKVICKNILEKILQYSESQIDAAKDVIDILLQHFQTQLQSNIITLVELLNHPVPEVYEFALSYFVTNVYELRKNELSALINHQNRKINKIVTEVIFNRVDNFNSESLQIYILIELIKFNSSQIDKSVVIEKFINKFSIDELVDNLNDSDILVFFKSSNLSLREKGKLILLNILPSLHSESGINFATQLLTSYYQDVQEFAYDVFRNQIPINVFTPNSLVNIYGIKKPECIQLSLDLLNLYFEFLNTTLIHNKPVYNQIILNFIQILLDDYETQFGATLIMLLQESLPKWKKCVNKKLLLQVLQAKSPSVPELAVFILKSDFEYFAQELTNSEIITITNHSILSVREVGRLFILQNLDKFCENGMSAIIELLKSYYQDTQQFAYDVFKTKFAISLFTPRILVHIAEIEQLPAIQLSIDLLNQYFEYLNSIVIQKQTVYIQIILDFIQILLVDNDSYFGTVLITLLQENLPKWKECVNKELLLQILQAKSAIVPELAVFILNSDLEHFAQEYTNSEITTMTNHDILAVREVGRRLVMLSLNNIRNNIEEILNTVQLLESKWEDTQNFGFTIFTTELTIQELTPSVLIRICDSTNKVVRKFGRDLLTNCDGNIAKHEYILKFSEHPSQDIQMFVAHYLDEAAGNLEQLRALVPYFNTVLSNINCNGGAKKRVLKFLEQEALKSEAAAVIITEIMKRQSGVMAITDKAIVIQIMLKIRKAYPQLELPIKIQDVVEKRGRG